MDSDHVVLSALQPETVANRLYERDDAEETDDLAVGEEDRDDNE